MILAILAFLIQADASPRATIAGQVRMTDGTPAVAVRVAAIPAPRENVRAADGQNYYATQQPAALAFTDSEGRYRLSPPPGRYLVIAGLVGGGTFYPSTTDIDTAVALTVDAGSTQAAADVTLLTFPGARVSGRITPPPAPSAREFAAIAGVGIGEMLEVPVAADGTFQLGRIPPGNYFLNVFPNPPGQPSLPFRVEDRDVTSLELVRPQVRRVSGRIVVERGPLPASLLGFSTEQGYVRTAINPDLTFSVGLHAARHRVELDGLPVGYEMRAVRIGDQDVTRSGIRVTDRDVDGVTIEVGVRRPLPTIRGRLSGFVSGNLPARVRLSGPLVGALEAQVDRAGTFTIGDVPPGLYHVAIPDRPEMKEIDFVVTSSGGDVTISAAR
jgi:hypothetical protein